MSKTPRVIIFWLSKRCRKPKQLGLATAVGSAAIIHSLAIDLSINNAIDRSKGGKVRAAHAPAQQRLGSPDAGEAGAQVAEELALGVGSAVRQGVLRELPDPLVGVELGGIAREAVQMQAGVAGLQRTDGIAAVDLAIVPDHDHGATEMAKEIPEEGADLGVLDVLG